jgi:predicted dehydrogenase
MTTIANDRSITPPMADYWTTEAGARATSNVQSGVRPPLKVAIVGCGKIADGHVEEIRRTGKATVVAVCDLELLMAEQLAVRYGIHAYYADFEELLERHGPDVVHITTSPESHYPLAARALDAGSHTYVEKPLTPDYATTQKLVEHALRRDRKLTVGWSPHFDPPARELRAAIATGAVGEIVHVESFLGYNLDGPFGAAILGDSQHWVHRLPGKLFQNNLDHLMNKLADFIPDDQPEVHAFGARRRRRLNGDATDGMLDELRVVVIGERTTGYATFSSHARPTGHFLTVFGTAGTAHVDIASRTLTCEPSSSLPGAFGRLAPPFQKSWRYFREGTRNVRRFRKSDFHFFAGMGWLMSAFYDSIRDDAPLPIAYSEMLRVSRMMDAVFAQLHQEGSAE